MRVPFILSQQRFVPMPACVHSARGLVIDNVQKWMLDSGASYHIIRKACVAEPDGRVMPALRAPWVDTASGRVQLTDIVHTNVLAIQERLEAYVVEKASNVLSVGKLCRDCDCTFMWKGGESAPIFLDR